MNRRGPTLPAEALLYVLLLAGASILRGALLGWPPLNDAEAGQALVAAAEAGSIPARWGESSPPAPQAPSYHALTAILFEILPTNDAIARWIPLLAGIALVAMPLLARGAIGATSALIAAMLLALSPILVTASRTAGGLSLSLGGAVLAITLLVGKRDNGSAAKSLWAAAGLGLMLASGPSSLTGLLGISLGILGAKLIWRDLDLPGWGAARAPRWQQVVVAVATAVGVSSGFGFFPGGLTGVSGSLTTWLSGWLSPGPVHGLTVMLALPIYDPLLLVFGLAGGVIALRSRDALGRLAIAWILGALVAALVYPSRQMSDLAWSAIPLAFLSARAIAALIEGLAEHWAWQGHGALASVLLLLAAMALMQVAGYASGIGPALASNEPNLSLALAGAAVGLGLVIVVLFGMGWSWPTALEGGGLAGLIFLLALDLSATWALNFRATSAGANELWRPQGTPQSLAAVRQTVERISQSRTGRTDSLPIEFLVEPPSSLAWVLRHFPPATSGEGEAAPELVFVPDGTDLTTLRADYIGQRVIIGEVWGWDGILPPDAITWWSHHEGPAVLDPWLLLVRVDIATLGGLTELPADAP